MLVRQWTVRVAPGRLGKLDEFARTRSLPMFQSFPGCLGVLFVGDQEQYTVITFWQGADSVRAAEASALYKSTVQALGETALLGGEPKLWIQEMRDGHVDATALEEALLR